MALALLENDIRKLLPNLKHELIAKCLKKPTYLPDGTYNQTKVNELLTQSKS